MCVLDKKEKGLSIYSDRYLSTKNIPILYRLACLS